MSKFKKSQIFMLLLLLTILFLIPLIPSSLRTKYLYLVLNLLIIALGAEAGLLSRSLPKKHPQQSCPNNNINHTPKETLEGNGDIHDQASSNIEINDQKNVGHVKTRVVEKSKSEKIKGNNNIVNKVNVKVVKKSPSMPSLFFIGGGESTNNNNEQANYVEDQHNFIINEENIVIEEQLGEEVGVLSGQELFTKAENFIGNFYKQLKIQREESWKRIHGFYHKTF